MLWVADCACYSHALPYCAMRGGFSVVIPSIFTFVYQTFPELLIGAQIVLLGFL